MRLRAVVAPPFTEKHTAEVNGSLSAHGSDLQAGYALSDHFGILGSWYRRRDRQIASAYYNDGLGFRAFDSVRYGRGLISLGCGILYAGGQVEALFL